QLMIGMHNYHDAHLAFPIGGFSSADRMHEITWARSILPFIEQGAFYDGIPYKSAVAWYSTNDAYFCKKYVSTFSCPSDEKMWYNNNTEGYSKHNYIVCVGPTGASSYFDSSNYWPAGIAAKTTSGTRTTNWNGGGMFRMGFKGIGSIPFLCRTMSDILDGTSNTMAMSELILVNKDLGPASTSIRDLRGMLWYVWGVYYCAFYGPNTSEKDYPGATSTLFVNASFAPAVPGQQMTNDPSLVISARSRHSGGVNVAMADGSVRFVSNTVDLDIWQAASTTKGSETKSF
ncbi:MAG: DUF1559 domain-containing protein, partial [Planctomycetia bacterium]|nr:DUF1559 domain-containing protein [Planctomycetia bacterium]